ncbi:MULTISPECIES: DUF4330 domain-containing protein [unclassified Fusibacter]|uniref:DUF4330 domain-containing protein n=1 Tax=unclassified Fusibacter TaxID=2624464 RepID=UPI00101384F3|nr:MULTISPECIES: DUF4330 domain-containing protein [unclassified Fusibacter]MCK8060560.1 DUF4330 domain-containing protein [Fusibacter sp. A2]NPE22986.1 DUF4330 domain-containing protein [Fusibacter sp. A1]RXV60051.1 DUF4330 domain-containing protein [Fusibacter sp. A1]
MTKTKTKRIMKTVDWVVLVIAIFVVIGIAYKITGGGIDPGSMTSTSKKVTIQVEAYAQDEGMLDHIRIGDRLSESKRDMDAYITAIELLPYDETLVVIDERKTEILRAGQAKAIVTIEAELDQKGAVLKLGNQEVRPGIMMFLESNLFKFSTRVLKVEE